MKRVKAKVEGAEEMGQSKFLAGRRVISLGLTGQWITSWNMYGVCHPPCQMMFCPIPCVMSYLRLPGT